MEQVALARSQLQGEVIDLDFTFSKFKNQWLYIYSNIVRDLIRCFCADSFRSLRMDLPFRTLRRSLWC